MSLLTISIPIYNRAKYLERMLERFMLEKSLFEDTIHLFISDNCSQDDLESICQKYQNSGLRLEYNRNERNLGMDGNFEICISKGLESDYLWVLGSDDIPTEGIFDIILPILCRGINTLHLSMTEGEIEEIVYDNVVEYLKDINVMITFLSANIISSREIGHVDMKKYQEIPIPYPQKMGFIGSFFCIFKAFPKNDPCIELFKPISDIKTYLDDFITNLK